MLIKGIHWVGVCTADWDRTVAFYRDALGFSMRSEGLLSVAQDDVRCAEMALPNGDFVEIFDARLAERELFAAPVVGFLVDDVETARREMAEKGVSFIGPVYRGHSWEWSYFRSPEGHVYQIMAELKAPA